MKQVEENISLIIEGCKVGKQSDQKRLFELYYAYGMSIALRYARNKRDAEEIMNDAFMKVFLKIETYDSKYEFKKWFRRILINVAIDYLRKYKLYQSEYDDSHILVQSTTNVGLEDMLYEDLLQTIQQLPDGYRNVFNLYAIDGYKHREIAEILKITIGTSKSNYARGKVILQKMILERNKEQFKHG